MKKILVLFIGFFVLLGSSFNTFAYYNENHTYNELFPLPNSGLDIYATFTVNQGALICSNNGNDYCNHVYWSDSNHSIQSFTFNPYNYSITLDVGTYYGSPYVVEGIYEFPNVGFLASYYRNPVSKFYLPQGADWDYACSHIITSSPTILMTNTVTEEICGGSNWAALTVSNSLAVGGYVMSYPAGDEIYCPYDAGDDDCEETLQTDSQITLEATANDGYVFQHWDDGEACYASNPLTVTMNSDVNLEAVYVPVLEFPLSGYTSTTVPITAVMDHSLSGGFYTADGRNSQVKAFNGLIADGTEHSYGGNVYCYDTSETNPFPGLTYFYGSEICYDEHPGFDFAVVNGTDVLAPFSGKLYWATTDPVNGSPSTYGTFYIDHENGYTTWFLHCSGLTSTVATEVAQNGYAVVAKGDHIAESSDKGSSGSYHLHFEVRKDGIDDEHVIDPYGWELWEE